MPEVPEEFDVFHLPHVHMKKIKKDIDTEVIISICVYLKSYKPLSDELVLCFDVGVVCFSRLQ